MCRPSGASCFSSSPPTAPAVGYNLSSLTGLALPEKQNQFLHIDVMEWYHPSVFVRQQENTRTGAQPA
jgi:hypothetical protein